MAFMRNINDFILTLVALSLPSIAATIDCNGKPFHCLNSTHFMICVDFGSGVSSTMDDFVIPCPPTTVCQATNRFECEFPIVITTTVAPVVTNSPLLAETVNNDIVIDTVSDVTTIPFEEYFNTISTTTLSAGNFITRDVVTTELPINNLSESEVTVAATDSNLIETAVTVDVSPNYFTTTGTTLDIVTDEATVTELIPNVAENVNVIFEPNSNISGALPNATEIVPTDIDHFNLSENNTVDVTENYELNSTLLETIIGATNFRQFNTALNDSNSYNVTEPLISEATESIPIDDKQVYLTTLDASPDVVIDDRIIENVTESIPTKTTDYTDLIQFQSNSTLNETMSTGDIVQNDSIILNTALDTNGFALNVNSSDFSFNEITTKYDEQISTAEPILFEAKENTTEILTDDKQAYLPTLDASQDVFLDNQTLNNATESLPAESTEYKHLIQSQSNRFNNKTLNDSTSYDVTETKLTEATESTINIPIADKQVYLTTLDALPGLVLDDTIIENVTESILKNAIEYEDLIESQRNSTLNETMSTGDIVQNDPTTLNIALDPNGFGSNVNNSDLSYIEITTKYEEQISTAEPILFEAKENTTMILVNDKQAYLPTLDASQDVFLNNQTLDNATESILAESTGYKNLIQSQSNRLYNKPLNDSTSYDVTEPIHIEATESTISIRIDDEQLYLTTLVAPPDMVLHDTTKENVTESIPTNTTEYEDLIQSQRNSTVNETMSTGDIVQNDPTTVNTALDLNGLALNVNNSDLSSIENTTKYEEQISTAEPILFEAKENTTNIPFDNIKAYLPILDASPDIVLDEKTIENVTDSITRNTTEYEDLIQSQRNSTLNETISTGDIVQNDPTTLNIALDPNGFALNVSNSDLSFIEMTTKYEEKISAADPILFEAKENTTIVPVDDIIAYFPILVVSPDVVLNDKTIENVTGSITTNTTEYDNLMQSQRNSTLDETMSTGDIVQNVPTTLTTALGTNGFALNVNNSDLFFNGITTEYKEQVRTTESVLNEAKENYLENKHAYLTTHDASQDVFLSNKITDSVTESIPTGITEYRLSADSQSNTTTVSTVLNTNGSAFNMYNSNLSLNEDTTPYYEEQISTAQNKFELSGNIGNEITQPGTEMANITKPKLSVVTIDNTTVYTEPISINAQNAAINTDTAGEVTVKLNVIESGNKTSMFDDMQTTEISFKVSNHYVPSTDDSVMPHATLDYTYVKSENNTNSPQSESLTSFYYVENVTKIETETEEIHLILPKSDEPGPNETTTIVHGDRSSADKTSNTYTISNIDVIAQTKTTLHDNSARTDEAQTVFMSEVDVNDETADAFKNIHLLQPVTEPTRTPLSNIAHNAIGSDITNENPQEKLTFINRIELNAKANVTDETFTQNVIGSDINNKTKITVTPSNQIGLNNRVSILIAVDQMNTVNISKHIPNYNLETTTQEVDSLTFSNVYYQTDIEEISHDQGVPRNNILSTDTIESTPSVLVLTTESKKEPHFDAVLQATSSFKVLNFSDKTYTPESDNYLKRTTNSQQSEATPTTVFDRIITAVDTSKPQTWENEDVQISTESSKLEITSALNENSYDATVKTVPTADITNSPQQTAITSSTAYVLITNSSVNQVKQVTKQIVDEKISTEPSMLQISFTINETVYVATEQNVSPKSADLIPDQLKYTTTTETANDAVHQESRIIIAGDFSATEPSESFALNAHNNSELIIETLTATTRSNTATDLSEIHNLTVSNLSDVGVPIYGEEINGITVVDSLTNTTEAAIGEASIDHVMEKYPITIKKEDINLENSIKANTSTKDITITEDTKHTQPLRSHSIQTENINQLEIASVVTDQTTLASFIADDVSYTENQNKLADTQDRLFSNAQAEPNRPEILPERFGVTVFDPNSSLNKTTFIDGLTSINTGVAADTRLTREEINQQSTNKFFTPKISTTETLLIENLKGKDVLPAMPELKTNSETIVKIKALELNGDINANPIISTKTSSFVSHTERELSFTTSIQESKYQSNIASSTESWRAIVETEPAVYSTRPYTETLLTSSKPYTESNDQMSQDVTSVTPKLNLANNPSVEQYINLPQNMESTTKNVLTSSEPIIFSQVTEPSMIFPQVTEPNGIANQDVQLSSERKYTTQKSYVIDTVKLVQNQGVKSIQNHFINVTPLESPRSITKPVDLSPRQFTATKTQILSEHHVFKNGEQVEVPTTEKIKVYVHPIISPSVNENKPLVAVTAVPIVKSSNNISKEFIPNVKTHLLTAVYNSNHTMESVPKTEFNKVRINNTSTTEKPVTQRSDLEIVMVDMVKTGSPNLGEIATGSNTHSGISAIPKTKAQQVENQKTNKSMAEVEQETEKEENPETQKEESPEVAESSSSNDNIEHLTSTEGIPIKKQTNVGHNPPLNTKQKPIQNVTMRTRPVDSYVKNTTVRYKTKTKSPVANTQNSTLPASETSKHNFVCKSNNRGRFSDNRDCRKFYICIGKQEPIKGICPNNTVFSELRKQCTKNLSHCVRNNQFQCVSEGRFSDYLYDKIYYICVHNKANRFIRFKLQCQNGYHLNKTTVRCVLNTESILSTSQQSKSASEVPTSNQSVSAKSEKIKERPKTNKKFECKKSGKFPEPKDCRKYYVCTKLGKSEYRQRSKKCDSDEVYNRDKKKCVDADSYECS